MDKPVLDAYGDILSGNCYKVKWVLHRLSIAHRWHHVDIVAGETHSEAFRRLNPNAKVPLIVLPSGECLWESNAIIHYLAEGSELIPTNAFSRAQVLQWQCFEQYSHEPYIAVARYINKFLNLPKARLEEFESKQQGGHKALAIMHEHLKDKDYFVDNRLTLADISLFAYTHVADEGGFDLGQYPAILAWIERIENDPKHLPMRET